MVSFDVASTWLAWHRAFFDEVGTGASQFLYAAGLRSGSAKPIPAGCNPSKFLEQTLAELAHGGWGSFRLKRCDWETNRLTIQVDEAMEAYAFKHARQRVERPVCAFLAGVLAGILNTVASEINPRSPELVGWEVACSADQHDHCRFEFGEEKVLLAEGLLPPQGQAQVRWELMNLSRNLDLSTERLSDLEKRLAERDDALKTLLDHMNDSLLLIDRDYHIVFCNRSYLEAISITYDQAIGANPLNWVHPDDREIVERAYADLFENRQQSVTYSYRLIRAGKVLFNESSARLIRSASGDPMVEIIARNITEREAKRRQLQQEHDELKRKQAIVDTDLRVATLVHESLLPESTSLPELDVDIRFVPMNQVGGDYCHLSFPEPSECVLAVCDVSGHGMASALLATRVSSFLKNFCENHSTDPLAISQSLNEFLVNHFDETGLFVTFFAAHIDLRTFEMKYVGCGHPGPILWSRITQQTSVLKSQNLPLGVVEKFSRGTPMNTLQLRTGDRLLVFTDGVTEATNPAGAQLRSTGLADWFREVQHFSLFDVNDLLLDRLKEYTQEKFKDDVVLFSLEMKSPAE